MRLPQKISLGLSAVVTAAVIALACEDDPHRRTSPEQAQPSGGACSATPGEFPAANCDNSENTCLGQTGCSIDETRCGSASTCLPIGDNKGKDVLDFRIRRLNIAAPSSLAADFIQNTVVTLNIDLAEKSCGEIGKGLFTWLLRVDRANNRLLTGGAPPAADGLGTGFCFAHFDLGPNRVEPIDTAITFNGDTFETTEKRNLKIPIFLDADPASAILLPISDVVIKDVTISAEGDCIGSFNRAALEANCSDSKNLCSKWRTAGSLGGYITLEEADGVYIRDLSKSLCAFLSGSFETTCARDAAGKITFQGDYCSETKAPGGCADSVWMAATFAASAAKIIDGSDIPGCAGGDATPDAGSDAGDDGGQDAGSDAGSDAGDAGSDAQPD